MSANEGSQRDLWEEPGSNRRLVLRRPSALKLDPIVNRTVDEAWVNKLAETFNPFVLGVFTAWVDGDGNEKIIDGQHRMLACAKVGYDELVPVWLYEGITEAQAAALFLEINDQRNVHAIDRFLKAVVAGKENEVAVAELLSGFGYQVGHNDEKQVGCPSNLISVYRSQGKELLAMILTTITRAYPESGATAISGPLVQALAKVEQKYRKSDHPVDFELLTEALAEKGLVDLFADRETFFKGNPTRGKAWHFCLVLVKTYNDKATKSRKLKTWSEAS